jgi:predicted 2-oxoglutarate/Fe(II)-dependent dioxygenase YbiX
MDHTDAIVELKNIVNPELITKVVPLINKKANKKLKTVEVFDPSIRNVNGYALTFKTPTSLFYFNLIKKEIERLFFHYKIKFPKLHNSMISQIDLLKYEVDGKYEVHVDQCTGALRHLSVIINLNDNYEGGDLIFTDQKNKEIKRLKLGKGSVVFFPSNFMYPHKIEPITKGTRYSIVSWLQ